MAEDMDSYENALIQRLVLRLPNTDPAEDNLKIDRPASMSSSVTRSPDASPSMGTLEALPLELLQHISEFLDFRAISRLRRTCLKGRETVDTVLAYSRTVTHASKALAALGKIGMMRHHSVGALYATLVSQECASCGASGACLSLPTCERFCDDCVCKSHAIRVAALEICGFTSAVADEIFSAYETWKETSEFAHSQDLIDFATQFIESLVYHRGNAIAYEDDWDSALEGLGIRPEKRHALLKAEHTELRMRGTAETWAKYMVETTYGWLWSPEKDRLSAPTITVALPATPPQDHVMLYKGGAMTHLQCVWPAWEPDDVKFGFNFGTLFFRQPTDFSPDNSSLIYFAESEEWAHRCAKLADDICYPVPAAILHVAVPSSMIDKATRIADEDFKQLAFKCLQGRNRLGIRRQNLRLYVKASLLLGQVCGNSTAQVEEFTDPEQITIVKMEGEEPLQYAFVGDAMALELNDKCNGKIWIEELRREGLAMYREA
ncbi:hypothetical protein LTR91_000770 [Friedmanniomyces endolithicus]|uniref:F-box domain-containing protein n=1 Tax=Friedmanniomyces endolithicus TaxID=329885 RepID=A0AAN6L2Z3_9PEZI|nr:hypothetical protein LTR94_001822 [Friedmanniomyces endolithicus]KAK0797532.1 hypothetical protein LTR59_006737 [Friedmanniomyces endolithicus]KAK0817117.1 hypothetical protein LTR38_001753 [Friedmanniomyces endolithicus]KAK0819912.1 hypothetical protein LTR75_001940 [Friedmanniomyces endolithicus]KAK0852838.1 hypothetical protein LTR03_003272 [Friedmanniomyces endolithicus]